MALSKVAAERNQRILLELASQPGNDVCADCKRRTPRWASHNLGIFLCVTCASVHRKIGTHISKVKSLTIDSWTKEQVENMKVNGNEKSNQLYNPDERRNPPPANLEDPDRGSELESFIRDKYEKKKFVATGSSVMRPASVSAARTLTVPAPPRSKSTPLHPPKPPISAPPSLPSSLGVSHPAPPPASGNTFPLASSLSSDKTFAASIPTPSAPIAPIQTATWTGMSNPTLQDMLSIQGNTPMTPTLSNTSSSTLNGSPFQHPTPSPYQSLSTPVRAHSSEATALPFQPLSTIPSQSSLSPSPLNPYGSLASRNPSLPSSLPSSTFQNVARSSSLPMPLNNAQTTPLQMPFSTGFQGALMNNPPFGNANMPPAHSSLQSINNSNPFLPQSQPQIPGYGVSQNTFSSGFLGSMNAGYAQQPQMQMPSQAFSHQSFSNPLGQQNQMQEAQSQFYSAQSQPSQAFGTSPFPSQPFGSATQTNPFASGWNDPNNPTRYGGGPGWS